MQCLSFEFTIPYAVATSRQRLDSCMLGLSGSTVLVHAEYVYVTEIVFVRPDRPSTLLMRTIVWKKAG